jgi:hypothetical protein
VIPRYFKAAKIAKARLNGNIKQDYLSG